MSAESEKQPKEGITPKVIRGALQVAGAIPFAGGLFSAAAGAWSEREQEKVNNFLIGWLRMLEDEVKEKQQTILEIAARLDMHDEKITDRISSKQYQSLLKKVFREWAGAESEQKREYIRNILSNAAASDISSDDVIRMFADWIKKYSELHFLVIGAIFTSGGISRGEIWRKIGKGEVREDSADADLYRLLFRDLSTGSIVRQHRKKTYDGQFIKEATPKRPKGHVASREMTSAFDNEDKYELTDLGKHFVHYAMTDLPLKLEYHHE